MSFNDLFGEEFESKLNGSSARPVSEYSLFDIPAPKRTKVLNSEVDSSVNNSVNKECYDALKEDSAVFVKVLAGNDAAITPFSNELFSKGVIPKPVHVAVLNTTLSPYDRATKLIYSVLAILESHPNPREVLKFFRDSMESVNSYMKQEDDGKMEWMILQLHITNTFILLHLRYTNLLLSLVNYISKGVSPSPHLKLDDIAMYTSQYLGRNVADGSVKEFFASIAPDHNFIDYGLITTLAKKYVPQNDKLHDELTEYDASVKEFLNSPEMKELLSALKGNGRIGIKLDGGWCKRSVSLLEVVIKSQHAAEPDIMNRVKIKHC